jgi:hypothetical protein
MSPVDGSRREFHLAHAVNPVTPPAASDLGVAQTVAFECMQRAARFSPDLRVEHLAMVYPEDASMIPDGFVRTADLDRSVMDVGAFDTFRRLPLLSDLLGRAHDATDADWLIFTNVDICPMPHFYDAVHRWVSLGHDTLVVNRRTVSGAWHSPDDIPLMYSEIGGQHPGYDCFVFPRRWVPDLDVGEICVGARGIGLALVLALYAKAGNPKFLDDEHLTFHIGDDRRHERKESDAFHSHNASECHRLIRRLDATRGPIDDRLPSWSGQRVAELRRSPAPDPQRPHPVVRLLRRVGRRTRRALGRG